MSERIAILGAGAMGSALATPAVAAGHEVRLWGTWLDDDLVGAMRAGEPNPRTDVVAPAATQTFLADEIATALDGATRVIVAITSDGVLDVIDRAAPHLADGLPLLLTTKGYGPDAAGAIRIIPPLVEARLPEAIQLRSPVSAIGGPCKANEVAAGRPTATVYGSATLEEAVTWASILATPVYGIEVTDDVVGLEVAAAMKNVYAIALGATQGLGERGGEPYHNLQSAAFAQAVREMRFIAEALGGRADTVYGLPGVGDLEVTALSGRNKVYGARLGRGEPADRALQEMRDAGQAVEGVPAAGLAATLVSQHAEIPALPLLEAINTLITSGGDVEALLTSACLPGRA